MYLQSNELHSIVIAGEALAMATHSLQELHAVRGAAPSCAAIITSLWRLAGKSRSGCGSVSGIAPSPTWKQV